jgi:hypothetical protein
MKYLMILLIINSFSGITIYGLYRLFNWLLIERDPILNPAGKDRSLYKPYFFARENGISTEKCPMDQTNSSTTKTLNDIQVFDKTTRNGLIRNNIDLFSDKNAEI